MSDQPRRAIADAIRSHGPITFAEFMELALYGDGGFYETSPVGPDEDAAFVTSPHVHPVFAHLLASGILELWDLLGRPEPMRISEAGAGDGTLARQLLESLAAVPVQYSAIERSAAAREALARLGSVDVGERLDGEPHLVLAHELLDNLPFRRFRGDREVLVGLDGDRFVEVATDDGENEADETLLPQGALAFLDELAGRLSRGYALLIDYGGSGGPGGPAHGYRAHRVVGDLLANPGRSDITAGVDFERIARHAEELGLAVLGNVSQHDALMSLGFEPWIRDELAKQAELLEERRGLEAVRTWSGRSRATLLADPAALGRLRWMLLAAGGMPAPSWLSPS
ncbi:MAG TPA: SAM-dependent methyltransferase [Actinomycetota bacterium]|jgi:SAM-dependent MidA family methyltransferase|nr:SAM-dependent methyltransferase [Actinomycetota bacterium]